LRRRPLNAGTMRIFSDGTVSEVRRFHCSAIGRNGGEAHHEKYFSDPKISILNEAMNFVPEHGFTKVSLIKGAKQCGFPSIAGGMFERGSYDLIEHFMEQANEALKEQFQQTENLSDLSMEQKISKAIEIRLKMVQRFVPFWPDAMAEGLEISNLPRTVENLNRLAKTIAQLAEVDGNDSIRLNLIQAIYVSSELFMVNDGSQDNDETWEFVRRRCDDLKLLGSAPQMAKDVKIGAETIASSLGSAALSLARPLGETLPGYSNVASMVEKGASTLSHLTASIVKSERLSSRAMENVETSLFNTENEAEVDDRLRGSFEGAEEESPYFERVEEAEKELGLVKESDECKNK